jgi:hypothetical protein
MMKQQAIKTEMLARIEAALIEVADIQGRTAITYNETVFSYEPAREALRWFVGQRDGNTGAGDTLREALEDCFGALDLPKVFVSQEGIRGYDRPLGVVWKSDDGFYARLDKPHVKVLGKDFEELFTNLVHALRWTHTVLKHEQ